MKATRRTVTITASIAALAVVLAACGGGGGGQPTTAGGERNGQLIFGEGTAFPENLYPLIAAGNSTATANLLIRIFPSPFITMPDFSIGLDEDLMASEPKLEETGTGQVVTYEINPDAVWSDGTPITADDFNFVWRLQRSSDPADGGCGSLLGTTGFDLIESVEGSDEGKTVTVTFGSPFPDWKQLFTLFPRALAGPG